MNNSEIKEWRNEPRDNDVFTGEENVKAKKKKLDHEEKSLDEQMAEERKEMEKREEKEVAETRDHLRKPELEIKEKNAILEIMLKV